jgi:FdhD protein
VAVEEPMEIRVVFGPTDRRQLRGVSITMRTPGCDDELAVGFLFGEGLLHSPDEIESIETRGVDDQGLPTGNIVRVHLHPRVHFDPARLQRHFYSTSSCGVCGKSSLESLAVGGLRPLASESFHVSAEVIRRLPAALRDRQPTFAQTGGLHGCGLFDRDGVAIAVREDVGRHNAVDKLIGRAFLERQIPLSERILVVSGRVSFEILQKALVAGVPIVVAVGAPSSLAIDTARHYNATLVGFASADRLNIYAGAGRIIAS